MNLNWNFRIKFELTSKNLFWCDREWQTNARAFDNSKNILTRAFFADQRGFRAFYMEFLVYLVTILNIFFWFFCINKSILSPDSHRRIQHQIQSNWQFWVKLNNLPHFHLFSSKIGTWSSTKRKIGTISWKYWQFLTKKNSFTLLN